jgi:hypothetical protein
MQDDGRKKMGKVIAHSWADAGYLKRLHANPHQVLAEAGLDVPPHHKVKVLEDTDDTLHFVIPRRPGHLTAEHLTSDRVHADICKISC